MAIQMLLIGIGWQVDPVNERAMALNPEGKVVLVALWMPLFPTLWRRDHLITPNQKP